MHDDTRGPARETGPSVRTLRGMTGVGGVERRDVGAAETVRANRGWWDGEAAAYQREHGAFLGDADFVWGPEGLRESDARLLGDVAGRRVLEIGAGAAQCARWLRGQGAEVVALDVSSGPAAREPADRRRRRGGPGPARAGRRGAAALRRRQRRPGLLGVRRGAVRRRLGRGHARGGPGAAARAGAGSSRSPTRSGGRCPTTPGPTGCTVTSSYFDRTPYVELDAVRLRGATPSTTARWATGSARSSRPGCAWSTWSSRSGRRRTGRSGAAGARCAADSIPGTAIFCCVRD